MIFKSGVAGDKCGLCSKDLEGRLFTDIDSLQICLTCSKYFEEGGNRIIQLEDKSDIDLYNGKYNRKSDDESYNNKDATDWRDKDWKYKDWEKKVGILKEIQRLLKPEGRFVNLVCSPETYYYEWVSFSTKDFPENRNAKCGDIVKIINTATDDLRPVDDILWPDEDYRTVYREAGLAPLDMYKPLGREDEPYEWVNETRIAPWAIYVLKKATM
jgi:hypothetical protein